MRSYIDPFSSTQKVFHTHRYAAPKCSDWIRIETKNASISIDPLSDDLSVMLEPPTGQMVEPEEEVGALYFMRTKSIFWLGYF